MTVAVVAYLAGHGRAVAVSVENTREASNAAMIVHYSPTSGWRPASVPATVPGLPIAQPLVLAPHGDAAHGGLVVGQLPDSEPTPLPSPFLARMPRPPSTQVVDLANTQAYRYSAFSVTGSSDVLTLYTIPGSSRSTTAILCYASAGFSAYMKECEHLAATLTIAGGTPEGGEARAVHPLAPEAGYGRRIAAIAVRTNELLLSLRPEIRSGASRGTVSTLAGRLADGLSAVADTLSKLRPPPAAERVHASLTEAVRDAGGGYSALATAVSAGSVSDYATARTQIYAAEAALSSALKSFALLGYS